jgi:hypothetical protein
MPVSPVVLENKVLPLLQDGRRAVPEERVLKNDYFVSNQEFLFSGHVDPEVWVGLKKIVEGDSFHGSDGLDQYSVHPGFVKSRVGEQNENPGFGVACHSRILRMVSLRKAKIR